MSASHVMTRLVLSAILIPLASPANQAPPPASQ